MSSYLQEVLSRSSAVSSVLPLIMYSDEGTLIAYLAEMTYENDQFYLPVFSQIFHCVLLY